LTGVLDTKLRRDIIQSKGTLTAIAAIIAVGAGCLTGMLGLHRNLDSAKNSFYSDCRMADFWIDLKRAPVADVMSACLDTPGVSDVRCRLVLSSNVDFPNESGPVGAVTVSLPNDPRAALNGVVLKSGTWLSDQNENGVIVLDTFAAKRGLKPGDSVDVIIAGHKKTLYVTGTAVSSEFMELPPPGGIVPDPKNYGVFWVRQSFAEDAAGFQGACNSVTGILTPEGRKNPKLVLDRLSRRLDRFGVFLAMPLADQTSNLSLSAELAGIRTQAIAIPAIFLAVAAMALNVMMIRTAEQQRTIIGTFKALGVSSQSVMAHFLKLGLFVGLAGGLAGCVLGWWIADKLTAMYAQSFTFPNLGNTVYPDICALAVFISALFACGGALKGVRNILALSPAESMRPPAPPVCGKSFADKIPFLDALDFRWRIVARDIFRNPGRSLIAVLAAAFGGALLILAMGFSNSLVWMASFQFDKAQKYDAALSFREELDPGAKLEAERLPGVTRAEAEFELPAVISNNGRAKRGGVIGIQSDAELTLIPSADGERNIPVPDSAVLSSVRMAGLLGLSPSDSLVFTPVKGNREPATTTLAGVFKSMFGLPVFAEINTLCRLTGNEGVINRLDLRTDRYPPGKEALQKAVKEFPKLSYLSDSRHQRELVNKDMIKKLNSLTIALIIFAGVIFAGSILNLALISLSERKREIATYRVLGYTVPETVSIFLRQSVILNMLGVFLGLPLGWLILRAMVTQFQNDLYSMPCRVDTLSWIAAPVLAFVFVILSNLVIYRAISVMDWSEALKMKE
jgi:putative ABC transport system permease protein